MTRRLVLLSGVAALGLLASSAEAQGPTLLPVDRVVAVVNSKPILWSQVMEAVAQQRARGLQLPPDSAGQMEVARRTLGTLIDEEIMVQRAGELALEVSEDEIRQQVDRQIVEIRGNFQNEEELRQALTSAGFSSIEEYRRVTMEYARRNALQRELVTKLRQEKLLPAVSVTEEEITETFERARGTLGQRPATVTFRQVVIPPLPSDSAKAAAKAKADSLAAELRAGADFEQLARRESMDSASAVLGGDLGWARRGTMVPTFEYWLFTLQPGQTSPVFETIFGYHILRVDRVQPAERKSRHILIRPVIDSAAIARTRARADSVAELWRQGTPFDTLVARYHDVYEDKGSPTPFDRDSLPEAYQRAFEGKRAGDVVEPFPVGSPTSPKFVVARIEEMQEAGEYSVSDYRQLIREQLTQEKAMRKWLDEMRRRSYVSVRL